jgi:hypothetical protein
MARLLHVVGQGQGTDPPTKRKHHPSPSLFLTADESRHLRASIKNLARTRYGSLVKLARALDINPSILTRKQAPSPGLAVALWRLTGTPLDELLRGGLAIVEGGTS